MYVAASDSLTEAACEMCGLLLVVVNLICKSSYVTPRILLYVGTLIFLVCCAPGRAALLCRGTSS